MKNIRTSVSSLVLGTLAGLTFQAVAQTTPAPNPGICARSCWAARAHRCTSQMATLNRAVIHHTANASDFNVTSVEDSKARVRGTQNWHMDNNGWCDIGYHFLVDKFGNLFEGRYGAMTSIPLGTHDGVNANSFGFSMLGYFHSPYNHSPSSTMRGRL